MKKKVLVFVALLLSTALCLGYSQSVRRIEESKPFGNAKQLEAND